MITVNSFQPLTIITKCSILALAAVLDPPLKFLRKINESRVYLFNVIQDLREFINRIQRLSYKRVTQKPYFTLIETLIVPISLMYEKSAI